MGWTRAKRASWLADQCQGRRRDNRGSLNLSLNLFRSWTWQKSPSCCSGLQGSELVWQGVNLWRQTGWFNNSFWMLRVKVVRVFFAVAHDTRVHSGSMDWQRGWEEWRRQLDQFLTSWTAFYSGAIWPHQTSSNTFANILKHQTICNASVMSYHQEIILSTV